MTGVRQLQSFTVKTYSKRTTLFSVLLICIFVVIANSINIFITNPDPLISRSGLPVNHGTVFAHLPFAGNNSIEGNDGITKQALGVQAAHQLISGNLPLWNHYEGIGAPLLGETQSAALSPFTLLLLLPHGFLLNELVLEMLAGIGMYLFLKHFKDKNDRGIENIISIAGGCLYATLGTFMMLPNACSNPIAFLPWTMLGVTMIFTGQRKIFDRQSVISMLVFGVSLAVTFNSGFPEIAFLNLLLVMTYALILLIRTNSSERVLRIVCLAIPGILSLMYSLPWLTEFLTYINSVNGSTGIHNTAILGGLNSNGAAYISSFMPNVIGYGESNPVYGDIGGYFSVSLIILATIALCNKNNYRWHKLLFGGWLIVGWLRVIGVPIISIVVAHIPLLKSAAVYRYIPVSMSFSLILLACLGVNNLARDKVLHKNVSKLVTIGTVLFYGLILYSGRHYLENFAFSNAKNALFSGVFIQVSIFSSLTILTLAIFRFKYKHLLISSVIVIESLICFSVWQLGAYGRSAESDTNSVVFLQKNLNTQRFDSNILRPNYGSYFNVAQLSVMDIPIPTLWYKYISTNIDTYAASIGYLSNHFTVDRVHKDGQLGVRYLLVEKGSLEPEVIEQTGLRRVYFDPKTEIYELSSYKPYMYSSDCSVHDTASFNKFYVTCLKPTQLTRNEIYYPGWSAKIDGKLVKIHEANNLFQQIPISNGRHTVEYNYWPKYMTVSLICMIFASGVFILASGYVVTKKRNTISTV